ncbi:MAG: DUF3971 domain-containing protein, partial [Gammaproteobacteria bacterium]|nr:DUF3971 domain-containing protein [Gammaproteobacteria bacterium]
MMTRSSHFLQRLFRFVLYRSAIVVVVLAVLMSLFRLTISEVGLYRQDIERLALLYLDRPVQIEELDARMDGLTPTLIFKNVQMLDKENREILFNFEEATLGINVLASIKAGKFVPEDFSVRGIEVAVIRNKDGRFSVKGVDFEMPTKTLPEVKSESGELSEWLFDKVGLNVKDSTIIWIDNKDNKKITLNNVNIKIKNTKEHHQLKLELKLQETIGRNVEFALDVKGNVLDPSDWTGDLYLKSNGLHLEKLGLLSGIDGYTVKHGVADFEIWGRWNKGVFENISGDVTSYNLAVKHRDVEDLLNVRLLSGLFNFSNNDKGWSLDVANFHYMDRQVSWPESNFSIAYLKETQTDPAGYELSADFFRLENISSLMLKMPFFPKDYAKQLVELSPTGDIFNFNLKSPLSGFAKNISAHAVFSQLGFDSTGSIPGLRGINGEVQFNASHGWVQLTSDYAVFSYPEMFREKIDVLRFSTMLEINKYDSGWQIKTDKIVLENSDLITESGLLLDIPANNASPFMDLQTQFSNGKAANAHKYYPVSVMSDGLVSWLDRGIVDGRIKQGSAIFHGRLHDFPFDNNEGQFRVEFGAENAVIDYQKAWPKIHNITLDALFTGKEMVITAQQGQIFDSKLSDTTVVIENFNRPILKINGKATGELKDALYYLVDSPIYPSASNVVKNMRYSGMAQTSIDLNIPLGHVKEDVSLKGRIEFDNAAVYMLDDMIDLTDITGDLLFTESEQTANDIHARVMGNDTILDVQTRKDINGKPVVITAHGKLDSHKLLNQLGMPASNQINGQTDWRGSF